jgi:hypothetical protein
MKMAFCVDVDMNTKSRRPELIASPHAEPNLQKFFGSFFQKRTFFLERKTK